MFKTELKDFRYQPLIKDNHIVKNRVVLTSDVVWENDGITVVVPVGFKFDLASVKWWMGFVAEKLGRHQRAAALHDFLYRERIGSRSWADRQFSMAMKYDGVVWWRRNAMWLGVRVGGWTSR